MARAKLLFSTPAYETLARKMNCARWERGEVERKPFPDGERYMRILSQVRDADVALVGGTESDASTLELYDLATTLVQDGAHTLQLIVPWFGYQTMERALLPGEAVLAKTRARLLSSIPEAGSGNTIWLLDLHAEGIAHYFGDNLRAFHIRSRSFFQNIISQHVQGDFVVGAVDAGRAKVVESLANALNVDAGFVFKRRTGANTAEVTALSADVADKKVVLYDDMIRTGSSLMAAAKAYRQAGASSVIAVTTHAVLPGDALTKLKASGLFEGLICTDSHPRAIELEADGTHNDFMTLTTIAPLLSRTLEGVMP